MITQHLQHVVRGEGQAACCESCYLTGSKCIACVGVFRRAGGAGGRSGGGGAGS